MPAKPKDLSRTRRVWTPGVGAPRYGRRLELCLSLIWPHTLVEHVQLDLRLDGDHQSLLM